MKRTSLIVIFTTLWAAIGFYFGWFGLETIWGAIISTLISALMGWQITISAINLEGKITQGMIANSIMTGVFFFLLSIFLSLVMGGEVKIDFVWIMMGVISATFSLGREIKEVVPLVIRRFLAIGGIGLVIGAILCIVNAFLLATHRGGIEFYDLLLILGLIILLLTVAIAIGSTLFETIILVCFTFPDSSKP